MVGKRKTNDIWWNIKISRSWHLNLHWYSWAHSCLGALMAFLGSHDKDDVIHKAKQCLLYVLLHKKVCQNLIYRNQQESHLQISKSPLKGRCEEVRWGETWALKSPSRNELCFHSFFIFYLLSVSHPNVMLPTISITPSMDMRKAACWWLIPTLKA